MTTLLEAAQLAPASLPRRRLGSGSLVACVAIAGLALGSPLGGCAAMEQAERDYVDKGITVPNPAALDNYRRVGVERMACRGALCDRINPDAIEAEVRRGLTAACYETIEAAEMERYAQHFGMRAGGFGLGVGPTGMDMRVDVPELGAFEFFAIGPDVRNVVVDELGLEGIVKTAIDIGEPSDVTHWRTTTLRVELLDARGRQGVWQAQVDREIGDADMNQYTTMLARSLGEGLARKANVCRTPAAPVASSDPRDDRGISVVDQQLQVPGRIYFELGSVKLSPRSNDLLDDLAAYLAAYPEIRRLSIEGHTDDVGDAAANQRLSEGRALSVLEALVARGIAADRLESVGFGQEQPRVANDSASNRALNRRVEFRVVE